MAKKEVKFGITERGDIAFDNRWIYFVSTGQVQGAILISKGLPNKLGLTNMVKFKDKIIFHATTTGWGGTEIEPNVQDYETRLNNLMTFIEENDFPMDHVVIRVDPIIPTEEGFERAKEVIEMANSLGFKRYRYSYIDIYRHVIKRFENKNITVPPTIDKANKTLVNNFDDYLTKLTYEQGLTFESCAESDSRQVGCVSSKDFILCGLDMEEAKGKSQQRRGCLCVRNKTEMLSNRYRCPFQCLYCYWWDKEEY